MHTLNICFQAEKKRALAIHNTQATQKLLKDEVSLSFLAVPELRNAKKHDLETKDMRSCLVLYIYTHTYTHTLTCTHTHSLSLSLFSSH